MREPGKSSFAARHEVLGIALIGLLIGLLAWLSPITTVNSDSAALLVASQAWVEHGDGDLGVYRGDSRLRYQLDIDYRIRRRGEGRYYFSPVIPLLAAPAVWLAQRAGFDMLVEADEVALQLLLSAVLTAWIFVLLYRVCRTVAGPRDGLVIALVSTLGSMLVSTVATGLWSIDFVLVFLLLALLQVMRWPLRWWRLAWVGVLIALAYLSRPTAGFFAVAVAVYSALLWARGRPRRVLLRAAAAAALGGLALAIAWWQFGERVPHYYSLAKLTAWTPLAHGLEGNLISPSRGLLVFCPFLVVAVAAVVTAGGRLARQPLFWLAVVWWGTHLLGASIKGYWWGGYSFGPRLLTETMVPAALLTALAWAHWREASRPGLVRGWAMAYLVSGAIAVWIHVWQGLFNPAPRLWNAMPQVEHNTHLLFDWRYPQFIAQRKGLEKRYLAHQLQELEPFRFGQAIEPGSTRAVFDGWHHPERAWQWSQETSRLHFRLSEPPRESSYVLQLTAGSLGRQEVELWLDGSRLGSWIYDGFEPRVGRIAFAARAFASGAENHILEIRAPGARTASELDQRVVGISLTALRIDPLELPAGGLGFDAEPYFLEGFSHAEATLRWTDGHRARLAYPLPAAAAGRDHLLRLKAGAHGRQRTTVRINGKAVGEMLFEGHNANEQIVQVPAAVLIAEAPNILALVLPDAQPAAGDVRRLGLALERVELSPVATVVPASSSSSAAASTR